MPTPPPTGSLTILAAGLVLRSQAEIDVNEFGLAEGHLKFACANKNYPALVPSRGTLCPDFKTTDPLTIAALSRLTFLGAHTHKFTRGRVRTISSDDPTSGVGILEVLCQGGFLTDPSPDGTGTISKPFAPVSTTRDQMQGIVYQVSGPIADTTGAINARVISTSPLPLNLYGTDSSGVGQLVAAANGAFPLVDGYQLPLSRKILVNGEGNAAYNGLYYLFQMGDASQPWVLKRAPKMDQHGEVNTDVYVLVANGTTNANTIWHCTSSNIKLGIDPIHFALVTGTPTFTPLFQANIDYHAIDLHFEYIASVRAPEPRFIKAEYSLGSDGLLLIGPTSNDRMGLDIESAFGLAASQDPTTGAISVVSAPEVALDPSDWQSGVDYVGTAARFEQTPAGPYWHVLETTTIKIQAILPAAKQVAVVPAI